MIHNVSVLRSVFISIVDNNCSSCVLLLELPLFKGPERNRSKFLILLSDDYKKTRCIHYWSNRQVLAWRLTNTIGMSLCLEALEEALTVSGTTEVFSGDQGAVNFRQCSLPRLLRPKGYPCLEKAGWWKTFSWSLPGTTSITNQYI